MRPANNSPMWLGIGISICNLRRPPATPAPGPSDLYGAAVFADSPVAWYRPRAATDLVASVVQDSSGNGYHFGVNGMTYPLIDGGPTGGKYANWDGGGVGADLIAAAGMD